MKKTMMSTYTRLLGFAKPLSRYAVPYFFYSVLHALFNTFTYTMIIPIIGTLFSEGYVFQPTYELPAVALNIFTPSSSVRSSSQPACWRCCRQC